MLCMQDELVGKHITCAKSASGPGAVWSSIKASPTAGFLTHFSCLLVLGEQGELLPPLLCSSLSLVLLFLFWPCYSFYRDPSSLVVFLTLGPLPPPWEVGEGLGLSLQGNGGDQGSFVSLPPYAGCPCSPASAFALAEQAVRLRLTCCLCFPCPLSQVRLRPAAMSCYDLCRPCGPTPLANSCNEACVRQCQDSRVVIEPSPVVVTLPGPILSSFPQNTAVGSTTSAAVGSILSAEGVPINSGGFNLSGLGGLCYSRRCLPC